MARFVYTVEAVGEEPGLDSIHGTARSAIHRLRAQYPDCPVPRGSVARLKAGEVVWAENPEIEAYEARAVKYKVW